MPRYVILILLALVIAACGGPPGPDTGSSSYPSCGGRGCRCDHDGEGTGAYS